MRLAPIGVVSEKLRSRSVDARVVALLHARGHGKAASGLAAHVASLLEDDERVASHAAATLAVLAPGVADAVPVLLRLLDRPDADARLVRRALFGLKKVGKEAWAALPGLEKLLDGEHAADALAAMAAIAPNAPSVAPRIAAALFSDDAALSRAAQDALSAGGPVDLAAARARVNAFSFSKRKREAALRGLSVLAPLKPDAVTQLMRELLRGGSKPALPLLRAMAQLPPPLAPELVAFAVQSLERKDLGEVTAALAVVERHGLEAPLAKVLKRHAGSSSTEPAGRVFATAARLLKGAERAAVDAWLLREASAPRVDWHTVAEALEASPSESNVLALARAAQRFSKTERGGVLDFHRRLRELTTVEVLDRAGIPVTDPYADADEPEVDPLDADYPEFPQDAEPAPPGRLEHADDVPRQDAELAHGLQLLGRSLTAPPDDLAAALQSFFERQQGQTLQDPDVQGLAAVWVHCLVTRLKWRWARWLRGDERALVLSSPLGTHMVFPAAWVRRQLRKKEPTALQQYELLASGDAPAEGAEPTAMW